MNTQNQTQNTIVCQPVGVCPSRRQIKTWGNIITMCNAGQLVICGTGYAVVTWRVDRSLYSTLYVLSPGKIAAWTYRGWDDEATLVRLAKEVVTVIRDVPREVIEFWLAQKGAISRQVFEKLKEELKL